VTPTELYSLILAVGVAVVAFALIGWQWVEHRQRTEKLSDEDHFHFASQEVRRGVVAGVMLLLSVGIFFGSRLEPRRNGRPNVWFIECWLAVGALLIVLLALALVDWVATRRYASRLRRAILREGLKIISDEVRLRAGPPSNGQAAEDRPPS
jgi:Flp pilus assembly protein TadB